MKENRQEKSLIKQNILLYLADKGVSPYEFYKISGVTRGILQQNNGISEDNIARFLAYATDVNTEWLLTGKGEMTKTNHSALPEHAHSAYISENKDSQNESKKPNVYPEITDKLLNIISEKDSIIREMAEEIGMLKERIVQLEKEKGNRVSDVSNSMVADAG